MQTVTEFTLSMLYLDSSSMTASTMPVTTDTSCMGSVSWDVTLTFTPRGPMVTAVHLRPRTSAPWSHQWETGHLSQCGWFGRQTTCPCLTRYRLMSDHLSLGVISIRANSVSSGVFVCTRPIRLAMRWTWVSTHTEGMSIA